MYTAQLGDRDAARTALERSLDLGETLPTPRPGDGTLPWTRFFDQARLLSSAAHSAALLGDPRTEDFAARAIHALTPALVKARAMALAETTLVAAMAGRFELCLEYGSMAAELTRDLDVSIAADILYEVVPFLLPYSDTRTVRELLPQLTRLTRTVDLEDEVEQK